jgi:hypothetical protein
LKYIYESYQTHQIKDSLIFYLLFRHLLTTRQVYLVICEVSVIYPPLHLPFFP